MWHFGWCRVCRPHTKIGRLVLIRVS